MTRISDVIGDALAVAERAENNAASLVSAIKKINESDSPLINVNVALQNKLDIEYVMTVVDSLDRIARRLRTLQEQTEKKEEDKKNKVTRQQAGQTFNRLVHENAQKRLAQMRATINDMSLTLIALERHELCAEHPEYDKAIEYAENRLVDLLTAVEHARFVENELTQRDY